MSDTGSPFLRSGRALSHESLCGIGARPDEAHLVDASVLQAAGFRGDVTVFLLNASAVGQSGSERAFLRNEAERVYTSEAAHNPGVAGSNPAPATGRMEKPCYSQSFHLMRGRSDLNLRRGAIILRSGSPDRSWQRTLRVQGGPIPHG